MAPQLINSVIKAMSILDLFINEKDSLGITEIANAMQVQKSTAFRLADTLVHCGYLRKSQVDFKYRLGLKVFELGSNAISSNLRDVATSFIHSLSEKCGETVHMGVLNDKSVMSIEKADSKNVLQSYVLIGKSSPLYCTSIGKALLAFIDREKSEALIERLEMQRFTEYTITDKEVLRKELDQTRQRGYAVDNMEHELGIRCISGPVYDDTNKCVASMSISAPSIRFTPDKDEEYVNMLLQTCSEVSRELGYRNG